MDQETIKFLIERKLDYLNSGAQVCILWWASSVVFCGSILGGVWSKRAELKERRIVHGLGVVPLVFFSSIVIFGCVAVVVYLRNIQKEIAGLANHLGFQGQFFNTEISAFGWAMWAGISSFMLVWVAWILIWRRLIQDIRLTEQGASEPTET